jgi:hypothetical protein
LRVADGVRRSELTRRAAALAGARRRQRRSRILGSLGAVAAAIRTRLARAPRPVTTTRTATSVD